MKQRLIVAGVGVPLLLLVLLAAPPWATMLLCCAIAGVAAYELLHTAGKNVPTEVYCLTVAMAVLHLIIIYRAETAEIGVLAYFVAPWLLVMGLFAIAVKYFGNEGKQIPFADLAAAVVGGLVFPTMYSCIFLLRCHGEFGQVYVLAPFVIAFIGDSFSMFGGMLFGKGKRKMAPHVSPNKTWAGGIAGPVGSALGMVLLGLVGSLAWGYAPNYINLILAGVIANIFGQLGDLAMSMIKREAGIKDYSHLFLTHGGMLDRFDSSMFIAPVVFFFVCGGLL